MRNAWSDLRFRHGLPPQLVEETVRTATGSHALEAKSRAEARALRAKSGAIRDVVVPVVLAAAAVVAAIFLRPRRQLCRSMYQYPYAPLDDTEANILFRLSASDAGLGGAVDPGRKSMVD